jgi:hypothetical protein
VIPAAVRIGALGALLLFGCSRSSDQAVDTASPTEGVASPAPQATQTTPEIRISDKHGTVNIGSGAVDPRRLGVPLFPGATQSTGVGSFSDADASGSTAITTLDAHGSFEQVDAWYQAHVPAGAQPTHLTVGGESTASYEWTSADGRADRVVTINSNQGSPIITISVKITK